MLVAGIGLLEGCICRLHSEYGDLEALTNSVSTGSLSLNGFIACSGVQAVSEIRSVPPVSNGNI